MQDKIIITRKEQITPTHKAEHEPFEFFKYEATPRAGFDQCYVCFYELPPQKSNYPYHYHTQNTEAFYILSGKGILLAPGGGKADFGGGSDFMPAGGAERPPHRQRLQNRTAGLPRLRYRKFPRHSALSPFRENRYHHAGAKKRVFQRECPCGVL